MPKKRPAVLAKLRSHDRPVGPNDPAVVALNRINAVSLGCLQSTFGVLAIDLAELTFVSLCGAAAVGSYPSRPDVLQEGEKL